jgi:hypothetical protein
MQFRQAGNGTRKKGARERNPQPKTGSRWRLREKQELQDQREWVKADE